MTVEILDAYARLAPWMPAPPAGRPDPAAEASALAVAARRRAAGEPGDDGAPPYRTPVDPATASAAEHRDWLVRVARTVRRANPQAPAYAPPAAGPDRIR
jgi:hypothetical protein